MFTIQYLGLDQFKVEQQMTMLIKSSVIVKFSQNFVNLF